MPRFHVARLEKRFDHRLEARMIERRELANVDGRRTIRPGHEKAEQRFRPTDVSRKEHGTF
jgi:hypothetical protein